MNKYRSKLINDMLKGLKEKETGEEVRCRIFKQWEENIYDMYASDRRHKVNPIPYGFPHGFGPAHWFW